MLAQSVKRAARAIAAAASLDVAIAYGAFLLLALVPSLIAADGILDFRITLADLLGGNAAPAVTTGGGMRGAFLVLLATATVAVPILWKHRLAPLAFAVPLLVTGIGLWPLYKQHRAEQEAFEALAEFGLNPGQLVEQMDASIRGPLDHLALGAWLLFAVVIYLAIRGAMRAIAARTPAAISSSAS